MTTALLSGIDAGLKVTVVSTGVGTYCLSKAQGTFGLQNGPGARITSVACT
jgi:hypothetical protein